ncbi:restriction endonuclease [Pseudomonas umsongensis]|uniref:Restriction endonuclease n=1 Tax=Pseudomonas umsongensis TaxID=198618 RepID=A0ABX4DVH0_9PSED|nr:restriction endonuclease subunit S [Pseudomonas umsongensis]OXR31822.1 restriction endonuclease [Pseudomonas umsongensis]SDT71736.1 type I restriction enzyme, S subunit [Pseudomonas umsongensis]
MSSETTTNSAVDDTTPARVPKLRFPEFREAAGWHFVPLNRLAIRAKQKNRDEQIDRVLTNSAEFGVVDQRDFFDKDIATQGKLEGYFVVELGSYVYNPRTSSTAPVGPISKNKIGTGVMSPLYTVFKFKDDMNEFYEHFFKTTGWHTYMRRASSTGARHDRMAISSDDFMAMPLPVSSPAEQQKIAACLSSLDELIAAQARKVYALKTYKQALMQQLFLREGETRPRLRFPEFQKTGEWEIKTIGDIFETSAGGTPERSKPEYWNGSIPWVTTSLVDFNVISCAEEFITNEGLKNSSAKIFPKHTVLVALIGQGKTRGKVALLDCEASTNQNCAAILPTEVVIPNFTFLNLCSRYEEIRALSNTAGQGSLSQGLIRTLPFGFPKDKAEQQRIALCLTRLDDLIAAQIQKHEALKSHKKGLMQQLFPTQEKVA